MTPNLRLNKKISKYLNNSPIGDDGISMIGVEWNMNYGRHILGSYYNSLFYHLIFFLQRTEEGEYRLIGGDGKTNKIYIIDDIEAFVQVVGICMLDLEFHYEEDQYDNVIKVLQETQAAPCQGVIVIEEGRAYVYEHYDY